MSKKQENTATAEPKVRVTPRLQTKYKRDVVPALRTQFGYGNPMMIPAVRKVVVNMGIGRAIQEKARIEHAARELGVITGQKPVTTLSRKSVAGFKLRDGVPIGVCVTLRGAKMWEFLDRLMSVAIPRIRDFRGLPTKLDGHGNYSMGLSEQSVFPEINLDKVEYVQGMHITVVTSARTDEEGYSLLEKLGMPFRK